MKQLRKCPFIIMIIISGLALYGGDRVISELKEDDKTQKVIGSSVTEEKNTGTLDKETQKVPSNIPKKPVEDAAAEEPEVQQEMKEKEFQRVEMDYLSDALFIGDSRTSTLYEYAGWDETDFYVKYGQMVWDVLENTIDGKSLEQVLTEKQYGKIYIGLGVNELGVGGADSYAEQFKVVLDKVRFLQPDAIIFVESIMHVTQAKDNEGTYINNEKIDARNAKLKELADNKTVFYIDVNEVMDEPGTGKLNPDCTFDGVHLKVKYIEPWREFLLDHGIK